MENQEKDLKRFVIEYEDGTVREVKKGFLCTMEPGEDDDSRSPTICWAFPAESLSSWSAGCCSWA